MKSDSLYYDLSGREREQLVRDAGGASYTAGQIDKWVFRKLVFSFEDMTDIRKPVREGLKSYPVISGSVRQKDEADDGTVKALLGLADGTLVESVSIPTRKRLTFCISTMSGCPARCQFCASGANGLDRKLSKGEMLEQFLVLSQLNSEYPSNIVMMGMGEPLLNYEETVGFCRMINNPEQGNVGARKITISTIGIPEGILRLANEGKQFEIAFSLHHPEQAGREKLIPIAKKYALDEIFSALQVYREKTGRNITLEYCLLHDINDSLTCAYKTAEIAGSMNAKVNIIPYNEVNPVYSKPDSRTIERFRSVLEERGVTATVRRSRGDSIKAACGQLRSRQAGRQ